MLQSYRLGMTSVLLSMVWAGAATLNGTVRTGGGAGTAGTPVEGAKIVLLSGGGGGGGGQQRLDSAMTDAQGRYTFGNATVGFRQVLATKAGLQNGTASINILAATGTYTANITMAAPPDTTPGTVTGTVRRGSATGAPIANAQVILSRGFGGGGPGGGGAAFTPDTVATDAQGKYRFTGIPPQNNYSVRVTATGYLPSVNSDVDVAGGAVVTADFNLRPANASGSVTGKVTKASDGAAVGSAQVILSRAFGGGGGGGAGFTPDTVLTNAQGQYSFDSVGALNNYVVTVKAAGFQTAVNANVDVVLDIATVANFSLLASGTDTARGTITGVVMSPGGQALANARVILSRPIGGGGGGAGTPLDTVQTDAQGKYTFQAVAALSNYRVTASLTGYQTGFDANVDVVAGQTAVANLTLAAVTAIPAYRPASAGRSGLRLSVSPGGAVLELMESPWAGRLTAYDALGGLVFTSPVPAGVTRMSLPGKAGVRFLVLERGGMVERLAAVSSR